MKQSRLMSLLEQTLSTAIGFGIALATQLIIFPWFGFHPDIGTNLAITAIFTVVSVARGYLLRRLFEALHIRTPMSPAMLAVIAERRRQIEAEGWSLEHDDLHDFGELACAGAAYALHRDIDDGVMPDVWPWSPAWWKPQGFRRDLVRGAALILAEIERFDRLRKRKPARPVDLAAMRRSAEIARGFSSSGGTMIGPHAPDAPRYPETNLTNLK